MTTPTYEQLLDALRWRTMDTCPRDYTIVELLIDYSDTDCGFSLDEETSDDGTSVTLGLNGRDAIGPEGDVWQIVGWDYSHDYFMETGTETHPGLKILGWRPRLADVFGPGAFKDNLPGEGR